MGDVTADIKTRYSIYVPKPLARINLGDWQKREGSAQSPKFGYSGVSIQSEGSLFVDVTKGSYVQARGGFVAQALDWLQVSKNAMTMATADNATVGADGVITVAAGAGHAPTWTLDHGDLLEVYPYNNLSLHYRVEEVQNSLFEFFRGRRDRHQPPSSLTGILARLFKAEPIFNSSTKTGLSFALNPFSDEGSNPLGHEGAKETETEAELQGGFERIAETSWQELYRETKFKYGDAGADGKKTAPHDIFGSIGDVRLDPTKELAKIVKDAPGELSEPALRYGYSAYFSRFDPYALIDPESDAVKASKVLKLLALMQNGVTRLKRTVDVVYKLPTLMKDNAIGKLAQGAWGAVDASYGAIKAFRMQYEVFEAMHRGTRGNLFDQFADERASGVDARGAKMAALSEKWTTASTSQATVRSAQPDGSSGFFGGGRPLKQGDTLTIVTDQGTFTTPPLTMPLPATAAVIKGSSGAPGFRYGDGAWVSAKIDGGSWTTIDLTLVPNARPLAATGTLAAALFGPSGALRGQTLRISVHGGEDAHVTFDPAGVADQAALTAAVAGAFPGLTATITANVMTIACKECGPGASIEVKASGGAAALMGISTTRVSGPTLSSVQTYVQQQIGGAATLSDNKLTITSPTTGASSKIRLGESPAGMLANLGLTTSSADGADQRWAPKDITAADLAAWFKATSGASGKVEFSADGGQLLIKSATKGDGSRVQISGDMATSLDFTGETSGDAGKDEIFDDPHRRGLDSFFKLDNEVLKLPDDVANLMRPVVNFYKNAVGAVNKLVSAAKAIAKAIGIKLPTNKGSIGLIANKGISLGTPDRIVGAGGQGIVFIADGGTGAPDHAKYAPLEDLVNRVLGGDLFTAFTPPKPPKTSLGFRVFSDSTVDLTARSTAHLLALGRAKAGNKVVGSGVAKVAGSYAVEVCGQEKVVIGAREEKDGRVEVLGSTIALGYTEGDVIENHFGLEDRDKAKGWPPDFAAKHPKTSAVLVHAAEQASIVVGPYMVQLRSTKQQDDTLAAAEERKERVQRRVQSLEKKLNDQRKILRENVMFTEGQAYVDALAEAARLEPVVREANKDLTRAEKAVTSARETNDEGIVISMRDPADLKNKAASSWAHKGKPAIVVSDKGVTVTTKIGEDDDDATARITLDDKGVSIKVGKKAGVLIKKDKIEISDGTKKATLGNNKFDFDGGTIDFSKAQKVTLG